MSDVILVVDKYMSNVLLNYDIDLTEKTDDIILYYIRSTEEKVLHDIVEGMIGMRDEIYRKEELMRIGFSEEDIETLSWNDFDVELTSIDLEVEHNGYLIIEK